ncbi:MAG: DUF2306 domain-containing protein [Pacificimonas sp.]
MTALSLRPTFRLPRFRDIMRFTIILGAVPLTGLMTLAIVRGSFGLSAINLFDLPVAIIIHIITLYVAVTTGAFVFAARKGTKVHRITGRVWCLMMATTAIATIFIRTSPDDSFSLIHLFTVATLVSVPLGIWQAMNRKIAAHEITFGQLYVGALLVAGVFAFQGNRTMAVLAWG